MTCQTCRSDTTTYPGLLQPLSILERAWVEVSMDFVKGLPPSKRKSSILVVVDKLTKYGHFMALAHPYTAASNAIVHGLSIQVAWGTHHYCV